MYISLGYISICEIDVDLCRIVIRSKWKATLINTKFNDEDSNYYRDL